MKTEKKQNTEEQIPNENVQEKDVQNETINSDENTEPKKSNQTLPAGQKRRKNRRKTSGSSDNIQKVSLDSKASDQNNISEKKTGKKKSSGRFMRRFGAVLVAFFGTVLMVGETFGIVTYGVPYLVLYMFQSVGITIEEGLTLTEFSVSDAVVMTSLWVLPCICMIIIVALAQWKLLCFVFKHIANLCKRAFRKENKNQ